MNGRLTNIYALVDPRDKQIKYIGRTVQTLAKRLSQHITRSKKADYHVARWIKCLLAKSLMPEIIFLEQTYDSSVREKYWIAYFKGIGCGLTNGTEGGDGSLGYKHTDETRKKMSAIGKESPRSEENERKRLAGYRKFMETYIIKPETRKKISESLTGKHLSDEHKLKISKAHKGKTLTEDHKRHSGEARLGHEVTPETREKISKAHMGMKHTQESRRKMSITKTGRKVIFSPEHCENLRKAHARRREAQLKEQYETN